jgi:AcrR family transcriptional regulator
VEPLRERKKAKNREAIEAAALCLFASQGYDATSVEQIAAAADVSVRTFYRYFDSKDAVMFARFDGYLEVLLAQLDRRQPRGDIGALSNAIAVFGDHLEREREWLLEFARVAADHPSLLARSLQLQSRWEFAMASELGDEAGVPANDLRVAVLAFAISAAFRAALGHWQRAGGTTSLDGEVRQAFAVIANPAGVLSDLFDG